MERDGRGWMVNLDRLIWEEPAGLDIRETEQQYLDAETKTHCLCRRYTPAIC